MSSSNTRYDLSMLMSTYKFAFIHVLTNHVGLSAMVWNIFTMWYPKVKKFNMWYLNGHIFQYVIPEEKWEPSFQYVIPQEKYFSIYDTWTKKISICDTWAVMHTFISSENDHFNSYALINYIKFFKMWYLNVYSDKFTSLGITYWKSSNSLIFHTKCQQMTPNVNGHFTKV